MKFLNYYPTFWLHSSRFADVLLLFETLAAHPDLEYLSVTNTVSQEVTHSFIYFINQYKLTVTVHTPKRLHVMSKLLFLYAFTIKEKEIFQVFESSL